MVKVSILMNGYNAQQYLKEAIDSIYAQTFKDWEIIFIDNCSTDDTKKIVDKYDEKLKYYRTFKNIPIGAARNFGLQYCKNEYLAFLDTDDIWMPDKLKIQIDKLEQHTDCQFCYTGVIYIDEDGNEIGNMIPKATTGNVFGQLLKRYEVNQQSIILRNNIDIEIDESLHHSPDFDLFMKIASCYKGYVIPTFLVKYRVHSNSLTSKNIKFWGKEMQLTLDSIFKDELLKKKYIKEYQVAYAKVAYYKAQYYMSINNKKEASIELSKYKFIDYRYFILYIASLLPISVWNFIHKYK